MPWEQEELDDRNCAMYDVRLAVFRHLSPKRNSPCCKQTKLVLTNEMHLINCNNTAVGVVFVKV